MVSPSSAVLASAPVPGFIDPIRLQVKDENGRVTNQAREDEEYRGRSVESNIPTNGLAEMVSERRCIGIVGERSRCFRRFPLIHQLSFAFSFSSTANSSWWCSRTRTSFHSFTIAKETWERYVRPYLSLLVFYRSLSLSLSLSISPSVELQPSRWSSGMHDDSWCGGL